MKSIPFSIPDVYEGFAETEGLIRLEADVLIMEFETKDSLVGFLKSKLKEVQVPLNELSAVSFKKKHFKALLTLSSNKMSLFADVPASKQGEVTLQFARKNRDEAEHLASSLSQKVS